MKETPISSLPGIPMLLALLAAIAGAMTGRRQVVRKLDETVRYRSRP